MWPDLSSLSSPLILPPLLALSNHRPAVDPPHDAASIHPHTRRRREICTRAVAGVCGTCVAASANLLLQRRREEEEGCWRGRGSLEVPVPAHVEQFFAFFLPFPSFCFVFCIIINHPRRSVNKIAADQSLCSRLFICV